ncbi:MAG: hypothetical protein RLO80_11570 [Hyphomonas sp.]
MTLNDGGLQPDAGEALPPAPERGLDRWGRWLTLGANIGVVLGLIILIVEVRQNAALTRTAMEQQKNSFLADIELSLAKPEMAEVWVKAIRTPEALTDPEIRMAESHLIALMLQWDHMFQMEESGLIPRERTRRHIRNTAPYCFGSRFAKNWWRYELKGWEGTPMAEVAGPIIEELDENFLASQFDRLRLSPPAPPEPEPVP